MFRKMDILQKRFLHTKYCTDSEFCRMYMVLPIHANYMLNIKVNKIALYDFIEWVSLETRVEFVKHFEFAINLKL